AGDVLLLDQSVKSDARAPAGWRLDLTALLAQTASSRGPVSVCHVLAKPGYLASSPDEPASYYLRLEAWKREQILPGNTKRPLDLWTALFWSDRFPCCRVCVYPGLFTGTKTSVFCIAGVGQYCKQSE